MDQDWGAGNVEDCSGLGRGGGGKEMIGATALSCRSEVFLGGVVRAGRSGDPLRSRGAVSLGRLSKIKKRSGGVGILVWIFVKYSGVHT